MFLKILKISKLLALSLALLTIFSQGAESKIKFIMGEGATKFEGNLKGSCPAGYSTISSCPDGQTYTSYNGMSKCGKCSGVSCGYGYATSTVSCPDGQGIEEQSSNRNCKMCSGVSCSSGYSTSITIASCSPGQTLGSQSSNAACKRCEGTSCDSGYSSSVSCSDGQKVVTQSSNSDCKKCEGTACSGGYSTSTNSCSNGLNLTSQSGNKDCKACTGTPCDAGDGYSPYITNCPSSQTLVEQSTNRNCKKCDGVACEAPYTIDVKTVNEGQELEYQSTNTSCTKLVGTACEAGYSVYTTSCSGGNEMVKQASNEICKKCESPVCAESEKTACATFTLDDDSVCIGGSTSCKACGVTKYKCNVVTCNTAKSVVQNPLGATGTCTTSNGCPISIGGKNVFNYIKWEGGDFYGANTVDRLGWECKPCSVEQAADGTKTTVADRYNCTCEFKTLFSNAMKNSGQGGGGVDTLCGGQIICPKMGCKSGYIWDKGGCIKDERTCQQLAGITGKGKEFFVNTVQTIIENGVKRDNSIPVKNAIKLSAGCDVKVFEAAISQTQAKTVCGLSDIPLYMFFEDGVLKKPEYSSFQCTGEHCVTDRPGNTYKSYYDDDGVTTLNTRVQEYMGCNVTCNELFKSSGKTLFVNTNSTYTNVPSASTLSAIANATISNSSNCPVTVTQVAYSKAFVESACGTSAPLMFNNGQDVIPITTLDYDQQTSVSAGLRTTMGCSLPLPTLPDKKSCPFKEYNTLNDEFCGCQYGAMPYGDRDECGFQKMRCCTLAEGGTRGQQCFKCVDTADTGVVDDELLPSGNTSGSGGGGKGGNKVNIDDSIRVDDRADVSMY